VDSPVIRNFLFTILPTKNPDKSSEVCADFQISKNANEYFGTVKFIRKEIPNFQVRVINQKIAK
jgi:hypothetical protein